MKSSVAILLGLAVVAGAQNWKTAMSGYGYEFPRDHFSHPDYQTEWWYYTGNLHDSDGHRYGFELTFFREAVHLPKEAVASEAAAWRPDQIYLAHLAFSDLERGEFYHTERLNRAGPGLAGATTGLPGEQQRYWNGNWQVRWTSLARGEQQLEAVSERVKIQLTLQPEKPFVINGENGLSIKGPLAGEASHYISFTRLRAAGDVSWKARSHAVEGLAWMDHEFFTEPRDNSLAGWDWFAIQLDNDEELMLYRLRDESGAASPYSSGTFVDAKGVSHFLRAGQFTLSPGSSWRSRLSGARYPMQWKITVPSLDVDLTEQTSLTNQELFDSQGIAPAYWEGAVTYQGRSHGQPINGVGYLEMTGYDKRVDLAGQETQN